MCGEITNRGPQENKLRSLIILTIQISENYLRWKHNDLQAEIVNVF